MSAMLCDKHFGLEFGKSTTLQPGRMFERVSRTVTEKAKTYHFPCTPCGSKIFLKKLIMNLPTSMVKILSSYLQLQTFRSAFTQPY